jgi:hypothetical protein
MHLSLGSKFSHSFSLQSSSLPEGSQPFFSLQEIYEGAVLKKKKKRRKRRRRIRRKANGFSTVSFETHGMGAPVTEPRLGRGTESLN